MKILMDADGSCAVLPKVSPIASIDVMLMFYNATVLQVCPLQLANQELFSQFQQDSQTLVYAALPTIFLIPIHLT